ncbi:MAG: hypothetical protein HY084_14340 [Gemmatimonadetes bacterium]|nr:hypothetical protein [Gemmatimonadota bacterium]
MRASSASGGSGLANLFQSRAVLWGTVGVLAAGTLVYLFITREQSVPSGVVVPNIIATPMSPAEAGVTLRATEATALVEIHGDVVTVKYPPAMLPQRRAGQLALAQQYARADEIVLGRKRRISFLDPDGKEFAVADPEKGVMMTR